MARRRTLTPEFFSDEDLSVLPFEARLLYAGLWCYADRDGRLEDRPKYLKAMIFPYDRVDVEKLLNLLASPQVPERPEKVFVRRYQADGKQLIDIPEFSKHQSPHGTEHSSRLPCFNGVLTVKERLTNGAITETPFMHTTLNPISDPKPKTKDQKGKKPKLKTPIPPDFTISEAVKTWAAKHGFTRLEERLDHFKDACIAKGYTNVDWDAAFRNAIRDDWAKLGMKPTPTPDDNPMGTYKDWPQGPSSDELCEHGWGLTPELRVKHGDPAERECGACRDERKEGATA